MWSKVGAFGSTEKRFQDQKVEVPGPGQYNLATKKRKGQKTTSNFKSVAQRDTFDVKVPNVGFKDITKYKAINPDQENGGGAPNNFTLL